MLNLVIHYMMSSITNNPVKLIEDAELELC